MDTFNQQLPPVFNPQYLLSFDFDGTLHDPAMDPPISADFFQAIQRLRHERSAVWGINTGRTLEYLLEGLEGSRMPFLPDWVVVRERDVYVADGKGAWLPNREWNDSCERQVDDLFRECAGVLAEIRHEVERHTGARWVAVEEEQAGLISRTEEEMEWIVQQIEPIVRQHPQLSWQRNSIYLRFGHRDFQKGSSLAEVGRCFGVEVANRFAMGDSHNDVEMFDPMYAGMIACPANAVVEIQQQVRQLGGYQAPLSHSEGVVAALMHYFHDL